jgi:hypothetical protein
MGKASAFECDMLGRMLSVWVGGNPMEVQIDRCATTEPWRILGFVEDGEVWWSATSQNWTPSEREATSYDDLRSAWEDAQLAMVTEYD